MPKKIYKYLTVDDDNKAWVWTTKDLFKTEAGYWFPRKESVLKVGTFINPDFVPPALLEKAKTQVVKIKPIVIEEAQDD